MKGTNMKRTRRTLALAAGVLAALGVIIWAQDTAAGSLTGTLHVTANVVGACDNLEVEDVHFPDFSGEEVTATGTISVSCTDGASHLIRLDDGQNWHPLGAGGLAGTRHMHGPNGELLAYQLYKDSAHTDTWGGDCVPGVLGCALNFRPQGLLAVGNSAAQAFPVHGRVFGGPTPTNGFYEDVVNIQVDF